MSVASIREATPTSRILRLALGAQPFTYRAGQAAMIGRAGDVELVPYSIASSPEETAAGGWLEFLVKADPTARFGAHVDTLRPGAEVIVSGPVGTFVFPDQPAERDFLFIAGGTGISPLRSMIFHAAAALSDARLKLLYTARSRDEFAYVQDLEALERRGALSLTLTLTRETPARWRHKHGRPGLELLQPLVDSPDTLAFLCGPPAMIADLTPVLMSLGVQQDRIRVEGW